jgi:catechol 2,3-dioxygenase-like lactoylglutathione lyase family enzyme
MEQVISRLVKAFEDGRVSRRELIRSVALTVTAASAARAAEPGAAPFQAVAVNHISYGVSDYGRTRDFYAGLLGMKVSGDDGKSCTLGFGDSFLVVRKTRQPDGTPFVDHFAITIDEWDREAVEAELRRRGLEPRPDTEDSFHVNDPDGFRLQISGRGMKA